MFLKVKLIFASVLMYHLWAFREARVRICLKNSNLSISTAQFSEKMPRIHNIPEKKTVPRTHSISLLKTFFLDPNMCLIIDPGTMTLPAPWRDLGVKKFTSSNQPQWNVTFFLRRKWHQRVKHFHFHVIIGKNIM